MENHLPSDAFRPEDEYPALGAEPIEAAEPVIEPIAQNAEDTAASDNQPAVQQTPTAPAVQAQHGYPQNTIPYMTYPMFMPMPGMTQYPQQYQQQYPAQQQYPTQQSYMQGPFVYPNYMPYFAPGQQQNLPQQTGQQPTQSPQTPYAASMQQPFTQNRNVQPPQMTGADQHHIPHAQPLAPDVVPQDRKGQTSTATKVFLIILSALLLAMVGGFIVYIINASNHNTANHQSNDPYALFDDLDGSDNNFDILDDIGSNELKHSETEEEITLVADDGATQKRDTDNPDSIGSPDKNAKGIELKDLPKDAEKSAEYTAKSSFNVVVDSVVTITCYQDKITDNTEDLIGSGSGLIISADGYVITNAHVLGNSKQYAVNVTLNNGDKHQAKIVGYDTWTDLAVLKIDAKNLKPAEFGDSDKIEVGDDVIAIGSPGGAKYQNSLTQGVISAVDREISVSKCVRYIQSDAAINPGSSGGPLCNLYGQVIGITTAKTTAQYYESMSFSIPSSIVKDVVTDLLHYGYVPNRARIGFSGSEVDSEDMMYYGLPAGVIVSEIADDGALKGTGVKEGDIITAIDGEKISSFQDIYNILAQHKAGDKLKLSIYRVEEEGFFTEEPTVEAK